MEESADIATYFMLDYQFLADVIKIPFTHALETVTYITLDQLILFFEDRRKLASSIFFVW